MPPAGGPSEGVDPPEVPGTPEGVESARRRRRTEVFGDVLPESTCDDRDPGASRGTAEEEWLRSNVPPHHG